VTTLSRRSALATKWSRRGNDRTSSQRYESNVGWSGIGPFPPMSSILDIDNLNLWQTRSIRPGTSHYLIEHDPGHTCRLDVDLSNINIYTTGAFSEIFATSSTSPPSAFCACMFVIDCIAWAYFSRIFSHEKRSLYPRCAFISSKVFNINIFISIIFIIIILGVCGNIVSSNLVREASLHFCLFVRIRRNAKIDVLGNISEQNFLLSASCYHRHSRAVQLSTS